ncbi:hypothetical protein FQN54_001470 [Arachnomyces sp. PD_36]|nr:hypothetical protein FQN54_001470 [Arachnomyces sp. PD_36]
MEHQRSASPSQSEINLTGVPPPTESQRESLSSRHVQHQDSFEDVDTAYQGIASYEGDHDAVGTRRKSVGLGLGLNPFARRSKQHQRQESAGSLTPLVSHFPTRSTQHLRPESDGDWRAETPPTSQPFQSSETTLPQNTGHNSNTPSIRCESPMDGKSLGSPSSGGGYTNDVKCPTHGKVLQRRLSWLSISILVLAIYSTVVSGIYLVVAFVKPRFGRGIGDTGLAPSTASLLSALFAKTIELSFVTVFVGFLGQVLSRRAIANGSSGITIADMSMRAWIMQPGTLITHWETVRYAAFTALGVIALIATFVAMLYTTAADALVSPKLSFGDIEQTGLYGQVSTQFANPVYLADHCETPVTLDMDEEARGSTCLQISHVGQAYHNYQQYIATWSQLVNLNDSSAATQELRPNPSGFMYDNTTVQGSWIEIKDMAELSQKHGRMINNITAAMPHAGVFAAARNPLNDIRQPKDLSGLGEYHIGASVPSPAVNVLCVGMSAEELAPLIYTEWPGTNGEFNATTWNFEPPSDLPRFPDWLNRTVVDDIFSFGKEGGQRPPIFPKLPLEYNTILNATGYSPFTNAIYLLSTPPKEITNPEHVLCSLKAKYSTQCSTRYHASMIGGDLRTVCEDKNDQLAYHVSVPDAPDDSWQVDWKNIASEWANSLSLNAGITDGAASNARLLTQMTPPYDEDTKTSTLNPELPSIAEALAVMAGSTLLMSSQNTPFVHFWNYSTPSLEEPENQLFNATLRVQDYASGGAEKWQGVFYVVLALVFLTNVVCLVYMFLEVRGRQMTDFTEPQNLFALAMNSPATSRLHGACGAGPAGNQFKEKWFVGMEESEEHYYIRTKAEGYTSPGGASHRQTPSSLSGGDRSRFTETFEMGGTPRRNTLSPAVDEFRRLSGKRDSTFSS